MNNIVRVFGVMENNLRSGSDGQTISLILNIMLLPLSLWTSSRISWLVFPTSRPESFPNVLRIFCFIRVSLGKTSARLNSKLSAHFVQFPLRRRSKFHHDGNIIPLAHAQIVINHDSFKTAIVIPPLMSAKKTCSIKKCSILQVYSI